jgi:hypothetical protein
LFILKKLCDSSKVERGRRIELLALAWKAKVLPLYEPRTDQSAHHPDLQYPQIPELHPQNNPGDLTLVERAGFEPAYS